MTQTSLGMPGARRNKRFVGIHLSFEKPLSAAAAPVAQSGPTGVPSEGVPGRSVDAGDLRAEVCLHIEMFESQNPAWHPFP